ncbi:PREDICTED: uncharacterized protein LOC107167163 [Diuraphis noxia]|uniref:uncharacterized protein LOC107167163 n=1 Tax=Diuraphis noxia TaxID=143948 RepID=UPI00076366C6|nr:PREDICTED: uncharacterized protein LOC107167163 [Diuraphis noxia]
MCLKTVGEAKTMKDYRVVRKYDILKINGKERLIRPVDEKNVVLYYVKIEELFDILHETHSAIGHGGRNHMMAELKNKYCNITNETVMVYLKLCVQCQKKAVHRGAEKLLYRRRTNREVQQIYQKPGINAYLMSKRIEWAGHVWRSNGIRKKALEGKINGKRPRGRPRQRWIDRVVKEDIDKCAQGLTLEDSVDRDSWTKVVEAAKVLQGQ